MNEWPGGAPVAVTLGWDDGTVHDRRLVERLNHFGVPATFFLNSGKFGLSAQDSGFKDYISAAEVPQLYAGHEVGSHTVDHPDLRELADVAIADQVLRDRRALEELTGAPVQGFASPFRSQDARVEAVLADVGIRYSRGPGTDRSGRPPVDPLAWVPAAHCLDDLGPLLSDPSPGSVFLIWGHSYEYDEIGDWGRLDDLLRLLTGSGAWLATHMQVLDALEAG